MGQRRRLILPSMLTHQRKEGKNRDVAASRRITHHIKDARCDPSPLCINNRLLLLLCGGCCSAALCDFGDEAVAESEARVLQGLIFPVGVDLAGPDSGVLDQDMRGGLCALESQPSNERYRSKRGKGGTDICHAIALLPGGEKVVRWTGQQVQVLAAVDGVLPVSEGVGRERGHGGGGGRVRGGGARFGEGAIVTEDGGHREDKGSTPAEIPLDRHVGLQVLLLGTLLARGRWTGGYIVSLEQGGPLLVIVVATVVVSVVHQECAVEWERGQSDGERAGPAEKVQLGERSPTLL